MGKENRWTQFSSKATKALRGIKGQGAGQQDGSNGENNNDRNKATHRYSKSDSHASASLPWGGLGPNSDGRIPIVDVVPSDERSDCSMEESTKAKDRQAEEIVDSYLQDSRRNVVVVHDDDVIDLGVAVGSTPQKKNTKRLDEYGFIVNIDDTGLLRDESSVELPGGAYTPSATSNANTKTPHQPTSVPKKFKLGGGSDRKLKNKNSNNKRTQRISRKEERQMKRLRRRREKKWLTMLAQWDEQTLATSKQRRNKLRQRVRKGIPNSCRGQGWARLANLKEKIEVTHVGVYAKLVAESSGPATEVNDAALNPNPNTGVDVDRSVTKETIERDLTRTFPRHSMFYDSYSDESSDEEDDASFDKVSASGSLDSVNSHGSRSIGEEGAVTCTFSNEDEGDEMVELHFNERSPSKEAAGGIGDNTAVTSYDGSDNTESNEDTCWSKKTIQTLSANCPTPPHFGVKKESALEVVSTPSRPPVTSAPNSPKVKSTNRKKEKVVDFTQAEGGQASLRRVLRAYSIYDPDVGYCQGMNFIAGMFITFVTEEEAFWLLVHVMSESPCRMRGLFGEGMSEAHQVLYVAERLISQFHPRLARHFDRENVHITMFATQWLLTMYTSSFPFDMVTRVWDAFLSEGWKVTYRVMLALLEKAQPVLMKMQFEDILNHFKELPFEIDSNEIMESAFKIPLKKKHIGKYAKEWIIKQKEKNGGQQRLG